MKKIFLILTAIAFFGIYACDDEFTTNPRINVEPLDTYFLEEANVETAIIGIYDLMQFNYARDWHSAFFLKILPGDAAGTGGSGPSDQPQLHEIYDYTNVSSSNASISSIWDLFYRTIALSNLVIENIKDSDLSNKETALAEAKFMRAWCYFELTTMFGDIPLRLTVPEVAEDFGIAKTARADVYAQIES
ncbi:RagB/SusD family nutrient uptake outer membrane protein, partial [Algibacter sp.]|uniref:RagB/SusD family nutrient uptake outer membrane protein n=1 Tax=Algibacter sp. TaxID=1872428 RepID=UPI003C71A622